MYGYHPNPQAAPPAGYSQQGGQPNQEQMPSSYVRPKFQQFSSNDFEGYDLQQLQMMKQDGSLSKSSIDSFNSSLEEAIANKMMSAGMAAPSPATAAPGYETYIPPAQRATAPIPSQAPPEEKTVTVTETNTTELKVEPDQTPEQIEGKEKGDIAE